MLEITLVLLFVVLLTFAESKLRFKNGMFWGFALLALFFSLRSTSFGNDLATYEGHFNEMSWSWLNYLDDKSLAEISWVFLNLLFKPLGFRCFVFFNTFFLCWVMYYLIKRFVPQNWWWFAVFLFLFDTNQFLINLSMLRQSMAISAVALSIVFMVDKKRFPSVLLMLFACTIHRTAYIMIPFLLISISQNLKVLKWTIISVVIIVVVLIFSSDVFTPYLLDVLRSDMVTDAYGEHLSELEDTSRGFGMGLVLQILASIPMLIAWKDLDIFPKKMVLYYMFYFVFCFASLYLTLLFRFGYYFVIWGNLAYPISYSLIANRKKKLVVFNAVSMAFLFICILYSYHAFFNDSIYSKFYSNFHFCF